MNKTIWVINQTAGTLNSGWGERHYLFSKHWIKKGYDVKIISGSYNHLFHNQPKVGKSTFTLQPIEKGLIFCWVKIPKYDGGSIFKLWSMLVFAFKVLFLKVKLLGKPDIIIVSSMPIFPILSGWFLKKKFDAKKLIFEIRDLWPLTAMYLSAYSKWHPMVLIMAWFEKFGYRKSDYIVSLLPNASAYINTISKNPDKFKWIPNGIDENNLTSETLSQDILNQIPKKKFIIGYTGTMGMANALEYFVEASIILQEIPEIHFVLVGDGYLKSELQINTATQNNITFISKIDKNQVQNMLHHFDVCFIGRNNTPLFNYGVSSNKYFDYMLSKKPILVSSNLIKDPVEHSKCGLTVKPEDAQAIADGILHFFKMSKEERDKLGLKGYDYVKKYHNFTVLSQQYLSLFK